MGSQSLTVFSPNNDPATLRLIMNACNPVSMVQQSAMQPNLFNMLQSGGASAFANNGLPNNLSLNMLQQLASMNGGMSGMAMNQLSGMNGLGGMNTMAMAAAAAAASSNSNPLFRMDPSNPFYQKLFGQQAQPSAAGADFSSLWPKN